VGSSENVLIVEDEDEWTGIYQRTMGAHDSGYMIKVAKDLAGAERLIDEAEFAVAFVDVGLDVSDDRNVDGLRVMEKIRATGDETSIVVVTGRSGQDVLSIIRDAIKKYGAFDTVGKSTIKPADIRRLLEGGLEAFRAATAGGRMDAQDALRGDTPGVVWDQAAMEAAQFKGDAGRFYDFLNDLLGYYLPVVIRDAGDRACVDGSAGLIYGDYWSRRAGLPIVICFGPEKVVDQAVETERTTGKLFGKYLTGAPLRTLVSSGVKGVVLPLKEAQREDFRGG
jgi:ActR/RegA family two-component response regulator